MAEGHTRDLRIAAVKAGISYFGMVFGAGFVFGFIRVLWVVPRVGTMWAELMETPLMLVVIVLAARWTVKRFELSSRAALVTVGVLALGLLLFAELTLVLGLRGMSLQEYIASRDPVSGIVYLVMLLVFALMPLAIAKKTKAT